MPLEMAQRAILDFPKRERMRISAGRSTSARRKYDDGLLGPPLLVDPEEADGGDAPEEGDDE